MRLSPNRDSTGKLLLEAGRSLEAKEQLQTAVALNPDHLPSIELLLDSMLALAMAQGSAASRDRETVINELVDRSRSATVLQPL